MYDTINNFKELEHPHPSYGLICRGDLREPSNRRLKTYLASWKNTPSPSQKTRYKIVGLPSINPPSGVNQISKNPKIAATNVAVQEDIRPFLYSSESAAEMTITAIVSTTHNRNLATIVSSVFDRATCHQINRNDGNAYCTQENQT